jgi:hypothetical protein
VGVQFIHHLECSQHGMAIQSCGPHRLLICCTSVVYFHEHVYRRVPVVRGYKVILLTPAVGVVVENFSYVFQLAGTVSLSREEMRSFKKVWTEFDPSRKGYLPRSKFVAFFSVRVMP